MKNVTIEYRIKKEEMFFMICKNCNTNNNDGAKFCVSCGQKLEEPQVVVQNTQNTRKFL